MKSKTLLPQFRIFATAAITICACANAYADTQVWKNDGPSNIWSTSALNWDAGVAWVNGNDAIFGGTGEAITINAGTEVHNLTFNSAGYSITGTTTLIGAGATVTTNANASLNAVAGTVGLTKDGAGTLTLTGTGGHTYTGLTSVNEGLLIVNGNLSSTSAFVDDGATLRFNRPSGTGIAWNGALTGTGTVEINAVAASSMSMGGNNSAFAGTVKVDSGMRLNLGSDNSGSANAKWIVNGTMAGSASASINMGSLEGGSDGSIGAGGNNTMAYTIGALNTDTTFAGSILGSVNNHTSITKVGTGTLTLTALDSAYDRSTTINAGTLEVKKVANGGSNSSIGSSTNVAGNLVINGGSLKFTGITGNGSTNRLFTIGENGATIDASSTDNTALTFTNTGSLATGAGATDRTLTLTGNTSAATLNSLASVIVDPTGGKTNVTKSGGNTWVLSGSNSYTGTTTIEQGTLKLTSSGSISSSLVLGTSGGQIGTLDVSEKSGAFGQVASVSGNGTLVGGTLVGDEIYISTALDPGFSAGSIEVDGNLTLGAGATTTMELGVISDFVKVDGDLSVEGGTLEIAAIDGWDLGQAGAYNLFEITGLITGFFDSVKIGDHVFTPGDLEWSESVDGIGYSFSQNDGFGVLTVIPEPAAALLGSLGMLALLRRRRA